MKKSLNQLALALSALGCISLIAFAQAVTRFSEYFECVNRGLHSERPIQRQVIVENCRCLHILHPFCAW